MCEDAILSDYAARARLFHVLVAWHLRGDQEASDGLETRIGEARGLCLGAVLVRTPLDN